MLRLSLKTIIAISILFGTLAYMTKDGIPYIIELTIALVISLLIIYAIENKLLLRYKIYRAKKELEKLKKQNKKINK